MNPWHFLVFGYLLTVLIETPVLYLLLDPQHSRGTRLFAGLWLTACTYPIVVLTLPRIAGEHYTLVAETFAPAAEILAFQMVIKRVKMRDFCAILCANLASFGAGLVIFG